ncbi:AAA family ATPase, partial [Myxococcota bacterium]|nr:AAA family ATPase [Myxococcota bacterium]
RKTKKKKRAEAMDFGDIKDIFFYPEDPESPFPNDPDAQFMKERIEEIPLMSPKGMFDELEKLGYRGQVGPRRAITLMAYRHVRRLHRLYVDQEPRDSVGKKNNLLLMGPTGSGKTFLIEQLFEKILKFPTVVVDVTPFSETGYVGQDPNNILTRLYHQADRDERLARIGIIALDEFDKLASTQNNAVFAGAGTTKDITGMGVQRELLKMLESSEVTVPVELTHSSYVETINVRTDDVAFLAVGAFSGFASIVNRFAKGKVQGFSPKSDHRGKVFEEGAIAVTFEPEDVENIAYFQSYGFLPELIARFGGIVPFAALDMETMRGILENDVIKKTREEFALEGIELVVPDDVIDVIVRLALKRETGARGLSALIFRHLEEKAFELFGEKKGVRLRTFMEGDSIRSVIE